MTHLRRHDGGLADRAVAAPTRRRTTVEAQRSRRRWSRLLPPHAQLDELLDLLRRVVGQLRRQHGSRRSPAICSRPCRTPKSNDRRSPPRRSRARRSAPGASRKNALGLHAVGVRLPPALGPALPHQPHEHLALGVRGHPVDPDQLADVRRLRDALARLQPGDLRRGALQLPGDLVEVQALARCAADAARHPAAGADPAGPGSDHVHPPVASHPLDASGPFYCNPTRMQLHRRVS